MVLEDNKVNKTIRAETEKAREEAGTTNEVMGGCVRQPVIHKIKGHGCLCR
jgi:hypothetical protein